jgi:glycosyltransferase involved in cell wall biosynthesis
MNSVSIVIPVYNEERRLPGCIPKLVDFLERRCEWAWEVVIADNGSTDRTSSIAESMVREHRRIRVTRIPEKGRGRAVKTAWLASASDILSYMDVDLSTDLEAFPALVEAIACGAYDLAIGSRLLKDSRTERSWRREVISRAYVGLLRRLCRVEISDAQCGFKAISRRAAHTLLPLVQDTGWFFDTELLVLAMRRGYRVRELPVHWIENRDSRVKLLRTAWEDLRGLWRLRHTKEKASGAESPP